MSIAGARRDALDAGGFAALAISETPAARPHSDKRLDS
jgi:hypothetical protein